MSWQDRSYNREDDYLFGSGAPGSGGGGERGGGFRRFTSGNGGGFRGWSVVMWLLVINAAVFILDGILTSSTRGARLSPWYWGNFNVAQGLYGLQLWRLLTYQFLHEGFMHILFNMIALYFFGPLLEQWWGSRRFLAFYLICGVGGAICMTLLAFVPGLLGVSIHSPLVGASGSIFGILVGAAMLFPRMKVQLLIPPVPVTMRTLALVFLGVAVLTVVVGGHNAGGEAAHLGGAALGFLLVKAPWLLDWADRMSPSAIQRGVNQGRWERKQKREAATEADVDRILDKVKREGINSLTARERKTLQQASDKMNKT